MSRLVVLAIVGFFAQLIDGALGMGYGVTSTSLLLTAGVAPVAASATVHVAQVVTTTVSGISHWRFGNINMRVAFALACPGAVGAFVGAVSLTLIPAEFSRPAIAIFLFVLGVSILLRFLRAGSGQDYTTPRRVRRRFVVVPLAFVAGFFDASGGGGWGPISTSTLMARGDMEPRRVVGSVDTSEAAVALSASVGFLIMLGVHGFSLAWVVALMAGGILAAPIAAWLVTRLPAYLLGILVAGVILLTNIRTMAYSFDFGDDVTIVAYVVILAIWAASITSVVMRQRALESQRGTGD